MFLLGSKAREADPAFHDLAELEITARKMGSLLRYSIEIHMLLRSSVGESSSVRLILLRRVRDHTMLNHPQGLISAYL